MLPSSARGRGFCLPILIQRTAVVRITSGYAKLTLKLAFLRGVLRGCTLNVATDFQRQSIAQLVFIHRHGDDAAEDISSGSKKDLDSMAFREEQTKTRRSREETKQVTSSILKWPHALTHTSTEATLRHRNQYRRRLYPSKTNQIS